LEEVASRRAQKKNNESHILIFIRILEY